MYLSVKLFIILSVFGLSACGDSSVVGEVVDTGGADLDPASSEATSHNAGQNCMACHISGGAAESAGIFKVAGTIYKSGGVQTDATVKLYTRGTNTLVASLETDGSGNFYTTTSVQGIFEGNGSVLGVDVEVVGPAGSRNMSGIVTNGACSECHGSSNGNITAN